MNSQVTPSLAQPNRTARLDTFVALFKLRIVALLLFAGTAGAFLAARGLPRIESLLLMTLTGGLAAMGASALNEYIERDTDAQMRRTRRRPLVNLADRRLLTADRLRWVPVVALAMIIVPTLAVLPFKPALAFFSGAGALIYAGIYTLWLKPRTVLNIVIGGFAGTCAVLSGGAAAGNWNEPGVIVLGLLVFLWTPAHFWSLALLYRDDYARVSVPMLPVRTSLRGSAVWIALHAAATGFAALALGAVPTLGWLYRVPTVFLTLALLWTCARLVAQPTPAHARALFLASNAFLAILLLLICVETVL